MTEPFVVYQGTFDPFTQGHLAILKNALSLFGSVRVLLLVNPDKQPLFSLQERKEMIALATAGLAGVSIDSDSGLLVDYMRAHAVTRCVRGVRDEADASYEMKNHALSQQLYPALQTLLLSCDPALKEISSSRVKEACMQGHVPKEWICQQTLPFLRRKFPQVQFI